MSRQRFAVLATTAMLFLVAGLCHLLVLIVDTFVHPASTWK